MTTTDDADLLASDIAWDLGPLVDGEGAAGVERLLAEAEAAVERLEQWRGRIPELDAAELAFKAELAEDIMKPQNEVEFTGEDAVKMQKLLDVLENLDDVQEVFTNAVIGE